MTGMTKHLDVVTAAVASVAAACAGAALDRRLRVTLNFHPDRWCGDATVMQRLVRDGVYRSQFETGTSNAALSAYPGGSRWLWEHRLFGGIYDDASDHLRPKYGALNHRHRSLGGAPRFGSAHLRLTEHVLDRTTFCFPDSVFQPEHFGTAARFDLIRLADEFDAVSRTDADEQAVGGLLDDYVEAHVHGTVVVAEDVEAVVLDPCYRGTSVEVEAHVLGVGVEWHEGRVLMLEELARHPDFRGPHVVGVGMRIAQEDRLDARVIGCAVRNGVEDPQDLKKVWHHVARFGSPAA
ncbi:MAG: DUF3626 domain-containing protein [Kineosporiaceae bacterium]